MGSNLEKVKVIEVGGSLGGLSLVVLLVQKGVKTRSYYPLVSTILAHLRF